jgi:hypothetical protein
VAAIYVGAGTGVSVEVEANSRAMRTTRRAENVGGSFRIACAPGIVNTDGSDLEFLAFEVGAHPHITIVRRVLIGLRHTDENQAASPVGATGTASIDMFMARYFLSPGSNGVSPQFLNKLRNEPFEPTLMQGATGSDVLIATTNVGALTPSTERVLDTFPINSINFNIKNYASTGGVQLPTTDLLTASEVQCPLVLFPNEGFVLRCNMITTTESWQAFVNIVWDELDYDGENINQSLLPP